MEKELMRSQIDREGREGGSNEGEKEREEEEKGEEKEADEEEEKEEEGGLQTCLRYCSLELLTCLCSKCPIISISEILGGLGYSLS